MDFVWVLDDHAVRERVHACAWDFVVDYLEPLRVDAEWVFHSWIPRALLLVDNVLLRARTLRDREQVLALGCSED